MFNTYLKQLKTLKKDVTVIPASPFQFTIFGFTPEIMVYTEMLSVF